MTVSENKDSSLDNKVCVEVNVTFRFRGIGFSEHEALVEVEHLKDGLEEYGNKYRQKLIGTFAGFEPDAYVVSAETANDHSIVDAKEY